MPSVIFYSGGFVCTLRGSKDSVMKFPVMSSRRFLITPYMMSVSGSNGGRLVTNGRGSLCI